MKDSDRYVKIVEWSEEDQCYVGSSPGLMLGGCHGDDQQQVFQELCRIVEEMIEVYQQEGETASSTHFRSRPGEHAERTLKPTTTSHHENLGLAKK